MCRSKGVLRCVDHYTIQLLLYASSPKGIRPFASLCNTTPVGISRTTSAALVTSIPPTRLRTPLSGALVDIKLARGRYPVSGTNSHRIYSRNMTEFDLAVHPTRHGIHEHNIWNREHGMVDGGNPRDENHDKSQDIAPHSNTAQYQLNHVFHIAFYTYK
ncbi:hypothetical protein BD779DRAFT_613117 [Infundibulicybe gibba]|nr:hypothetical protein BD779DRAFT_613117 [Infundibulicybe gibba]